MSRLSLSDSPVPRRQILTGDALSCLNGLADRSVDCVITSPPYFRLRDYQHPGQIGLEAHVNQWVGQLGQVMDQLARVLVPTGTVWLNVGDSYSTHSREGAPVKSLLLGPERLSLMLLEHGWIIRNKLIWAKTNPIPSSVTDRLSASHETIYLLSRQPRYFFDLDAIRQPAKTAYRPRPRQPERPGRPSRPGGVLPAAWRGPNSDGDQGLTAMKRRGLSSHPLGKNPGDVWHLATSRYRGAHFATYPEQLVQRMLLAGCPEQRCRQCRRPWRRPVRRLGARAVRLALRPGCHCLDADGQPVSGEPGLVLDPFLGSGTTAVVAEQHARDWLGIEVNPTFVSLATERIRAARHAREGPGKQPPLPPTSPINERRTRNEL